MIARMTAGGILIGILLCQGCEVEQAAMCTSFSTSSSPDGDPDYVETTCHDGDEETKVIREGDKVTYYRNGVEVESLSPPED